MKQFVSKILCFLDSLCMTLDDICVCTDIYIEMEKKLPWHTVPTIPTTSPVWGYFSYKQQC